VSFGEVGFYVIFIALSGDIRTPGQGDGDQFKSLVRFEFKTPDHVYSTQILELAY